MTPAQRQKHKKALEAMRKEFSARGARKAEPTQTDDVERANAEDDLPLAEMLQSIASTRNRADGLVLTRVQAALAKLLEDPDDFGACEDCGDAIAAKRLSVMPWAEYCVECQGRKDGRGKATRTSLTDLR